MAKATRQAEGIVSLKVTLRGIRPPVWRRLWVPGWMTLGDLHHVIRLPDDQAGLMGFGHQWKSTLP